MTQAYTLRRSNTLLRCRARVPRQRPERNVTCNGFDDASEPRTVLSHFTTLLLCRPASYFMRACSVARARVRGHADVTETLTHPALFTPNELQGRQIR